ncbi:MAG: GNAT family N-acetyltransferase [Candidatus Hodarchaeaceae archaeon]|nr:GNAT family N-acetyltransferase [Candidatus Hodarchaeaceae archaeon]
MRIERMDSGGMCQYILWDEYGSKVIAGATVALRPNGTALLRSINVSNGERGRGIGSALLERILVDFKGFEVVAEVFEGRVARYERYGFKRADKRGPLARISRPP